MSTNDTLRAGWQAVSAGDFTEAIAIALLNIAESLRRINHTDLTGK